MVELTTATWDHVVAGDRPVLVQFWAPWSGPCRLLRPVVEDVSRLFDRRATFARVNVDEEIDVCARYEINAVPTLLLLRRNQVEARLIGTQPAAAVARVVYRAVE